MNKNIESTYFKAADQGQILKSRATSGADSPRYERNSDMLAENNNAPHQLSPTMQLFVGLIGVQ